MSFYLSELSFTIDWQAIGLIVSDIALVAILTVTLKLGKNNKK